MERNICCGTIGIKPHTQRRGMTWKAQLRRYSVRANRVARSSDAELLADFNAATVWDDGWVPCGEAFGVAEVGATFGGRAVESAVIVEFLYDHC